MDNIPYEVATALLLSGQKMTSQFKKNCQRARERVCEPISRSTQLSVSAPRTGEQRLAARLRKATAAQLHKWSKRALRQANRLQDERDETTDDQTIEFISSQIAVLDAMCDAIKSELDNRQQRSKVTI